MKKNVKKLVEKTNYLFPVDIETAVERVKMAHKFSLQLGLGKLYVAFSGGKDSVCLWYVVKKAAEEEGIKLDDYAEFHYELTTVDPPELVHFIRKEFPFVIVDHPECGSMWRLIVKAKFPPLRMKRYCCGELKETAGHNRFLLTGVRWDESVRRKNNRTIYEEGKSANGERIKINDNIEERMMSETCIKNKQHIMNPIIDWTNEEVWRVILDNNLPYCSLYDEGWDRLGCIGCPMASPKERKRQFERYPKYKEAYIRAFDKMLKVRDGLKMENKTEWKTGEDVFNDWINDGKEEEK